MQKDKKKVGFLSSRQYDTDISADKTGYVHIVNDIWNCQVTSPHSLTNTYDMRACKQKQQVLSFSLVCLLLINTTS